VTRRTVRTTVGFFEQLDRQLPAERRAGVPSRSDFQAYELLEVVEEFATRFDDLPEYIPGRRDYRILIKAARVVPMMSVLGQLAPDGAIELIGIDLDPEAPW
jgi:hypothetical protein